MLFGDFVSSCNEPSAFFPLDVAQVSPFLPFRGMACIGSALPPLGLSCIGLPASASANAEIDSSLSLRNFIQAGAVTLAVGMARLHIVPAVRKDVTGFKSFEGDLKPNIAVGGSAAHTPLPMFVLNRLKAI